jgi:hypothetical protein
MRFFHSYWNKPAESNSRGAKQTRANLWLFALSVVYLKENNREIVLHTDADGERLLACLPYGNIFRTLDAIADVNPDFWCAGKLAAYAAEPLGNIHIDGDVFLKSDKAIRAADMTGYDAVVQCEEFVGDFYRPGYEFISYVYAKQGLQPPFGQWGTAWNTGLIGFNSEVLRRNYLDGCWRIYAAMMRDPDYRSRAHTDDSLVTLNVEQRFFHWLTDTAGARVKRLLTSDRWNDDAMAIDYCHIIGPQKFSEGVIREIKDCLRLLSPRVYAKAAAKEKELDL